MCIDVLIDMCAGRYVEMGTGMCIEVCTSKIDMCLDVCADMCSNMRTPMYTDLCVDICMVDRCMVMFRDMPVHHVHGHKHVWTCI